MTYITCKFGQSFTLC